MTYKIYHSNQLNPFCEKYKHDYNHVATVQVPSLEEAFVFTQNDFSPSFASVGVRSTSVGDVIAEHKKDGKHFMVMGVGFAEIPSDVVFHNKPCWNVVMHFGRGHVQHLKFYDKYKAQEAVNIAVFHNEDCINCNVYLSEK